MSPIPSCILSVIALTKVARLFFSAVDMWPVRSTVRRAGWEEPPRLPLPMVDFVEQSRNGTYVVDVDSEGYTPRRSLDFLHLEEV